MLHKTVRLDEQTRSILLRCKIEGCNLTLPEQLPRDQYEKVAKAIKAAGGKWCRKAACHVFQHDVRETMDIKDDMVAVTNVQQTYQAFYTPPEIANSAAVMANMSPKYTMLEPSAGEGALVKAASQFVLGSNVTAVEVNPKLTECLVKLCGTVRCMDFMDCNPQTLGMFDRILMNPPFTRGQDLLHIEHALKFLKPGGRLVAICAAGPKQETSLKPLASDWVLLPYGAFKESGTGVNTIMLAIDL